MANEQQIKIPDIGGAEGVDVIEILVKEGDSIEQDTSLITLESDKASMEIPSPSAGTVKKILVKLGDKVSEGDEILTLESDSQQENSPEQGKSESAPNKKDATPEKEESPAPVDSGKETIETIAIPDIGGATNVDVIDIMVSTGDSVEKEQSLITLEGDKATMDIPCPKAGIIKSIQIKIGDKVSQGDQILDLQVTEIPEPTSVSDKTDAQTADKEARDINREVEKSEQQFSKPAKDNGTKSEKGIHAGPGVRRLAHELGVQLSLVNGTGRKGRITKEDLILYVKTVMKQGGQTSGLQFSAAPSIDFTKFGDIEIKPLNKIKRLTGENVHRSWVTIPHVTQFEEADITELEAFRKAEKDSAKKAGYNLTLLAFVTKALCQTLKVYPQFNSSLSRDGKDLIYKSYYNIGIAVDTPNGLVVPVIKDVDKLSVADIAKEMGGLSQKAREKGLMPNDMSGGCMTISSLGGIGGTAFTPIVNSPEVAILGLSRSYIKPVYQQEEFIPRLMLPLSLSYDHRVIDGAEAAKFAAYLADLLGDIRKLILG